MQEKKSVWKDYDVEVQAVGCAVVRVKARNPEEAMQKAVDRAPFIDTELEAVDVSPAHGKKSLTFENICTFERE